MNVSDTNVRGQKSFPPLWKVVAGICTTAFREVKVRPTQELEKEYNELLSQICEAYGVVYDLTAYKCQNYPALVRGSNSAPVVGETAESTQVLVIYYLLREILKRQINDARLTVQKDSIVSYLDAFDEYTAGANLVKPIFSYLHWTWQKLGLPPEHVIQPTEIVVGHLWLDVILTAELKESFKNTVNEVVCRVRSGGETTVEEMESVKRFALNLGCATDVRLILYSSIVEEAYLRSLADFYRAEKSSYKQRGVVAYIRQCVRAVKKEDVLARCFLIRSSYPQVSETVLRILLRDERDFLQPFCQDCLSLTGGSDPVAHAESLVALYDLLGGGKVESWMEELLKSTVTAYAATTLSAAADANDPATFLRVLRGALHTYKDVVERVFGDPQRLLAAVVEGIAANVAEYEQTGDNASKLAKRLARYAAEEVKSAPLTKLRAPDNWISEIYRLCTKQEAFHQAYTRLLQERLLTNMFTHEKQGDFAEREGSFLSSIPIKDTNFGFVFNCMRMVTDTARSDQRPLQKVGRILVKPYILGAYAWGEVRRPGELETRQIPAELLLSVCENIRVYEREKCGRKLLFSSEHTGCRVSMQLPGATAPLTLVVSLLQVRYLLVMNRVPRWTVDSLCTETKTTHEECRRALNPFVQTALLEEQTPNTFALRMPATAPASGAKKWYDLRYIEFSAQQTHTGKNALFMREDKTYTLSIEGVVVQQLKKLGPMKLEPIVVAVSAKLGRLAIQRRDIKKVLEKLIERQFVKRSDQLFSFIP